MTFRSKLRLRRTTGLLTSCSRFSSALNRLRIDAYTLAAGVTKIAVKRESGCRKSRYRRLRDIERPRYIGLRLAIGKPLDGFLPLMWGEDSWTTKTHAPSFCALPAFACTGSDKLSLELGQTTKYGQHQPTVRRRGISPGIF